MNKNNQPIIKTNQVYEAPVLFLGLFYVLLSVWTLVCVFQLGSKSLRTGWPLGQLLMIAFVLTYTWYFSLGISYRIQVDLKGNLELVSFRRRVNVHARTVEMAEGPHLTIVPFGFIRFRLEREKAYLFVRISDEALKTVLETIRIANPEMKFKRLQLHR